MFGNILLKVGEDNELIAFLISFKKRKTENIVIMGVVCVYQ